MISGNPCELVQIFSNIFLARRDFVFLYFFVYPCLFFIFVSQNRLVHALPTTHADTEGLHALRDRFQRRYFDERHAPSTTLLSNLVQEVRIHQVVQESGDRGSRRSSRVQTLSQHRKRSHASCLFTISNKQHFVKVKLFKIKSPTGTRKNIQTAHQT